MGKELGRLPTSGVTRIHWERIVRRARLRLGVHKRVGLRFSLRVGVQARFVVPLLEDVSARKGLGRGLCSPRL